MKQIIFGSIIFILLVSLFVSGYTSASSPKMIYLINDNFNTLNKTTWASGNYSLYGISNGYIYAKSYPNGRYRDYSLGLSHKGFFGKNTDDYVFVAKYVLFKNTSATSNSGSFVQRFFLSSTTTFSFSQQSTRVSFDFHNSVYGTNIIWFYANANDTFTIEIYEKGNHAWYSFSRDGVQLKSGMMSITNRDGYIGTDMSWWWNDWRHPYDSSKGNQWSIYVDEVKLMKYSENPSGIVDISAHNESNTYMQIISRYESFFALMTIISFYIVKIISQNEKLGRISIISGITMSILYILITVGELSMRYLPLLFVSLGTGLFISTIISFVNNKNDLLSKWGIELSLLFFGLWILIGGVTIV